MSYCVKCGAQVEDGIGICPQCGAVIPGAFDTPDPQDSCGEQNTYNSQAYGQQNTYSGQVYEEQGTYNGQTYGEQYTYNQGYGYEQSTAYDYDPEYFPQEEVSRNKLMGVLSYLGILVLIPIIAGDKSSAYLKQHMNQGLVLFLIETVFDVIEKILDDVLYVGGILSHVVDIAGFAFLILAIMGIVSAAKGTRKLLPTIGNIQIFK